MSVHLLPSHSLSYVPSYVPSVETAYDGLSTSLLFFDEEGLPVDRVLHNPSYNLLICSVPKIHWHQLKRWGDYKVVTCKKFQKKFGTMTTCTSTERGSTLIFLVVPPSLTDPVSRPHVRYVSVDFKGEILQGKNFNTTSHLNYKSHWEDY